MAATPAPAPPRRPRAIGHWHFSWLTGRFEYCWCRGGAKYVIERRTKSIPAPEPTHALARLWRTARFISAHERNVRKWARAPTSRAAPVRAQDGTEGQGGPTRRPQPPEVAF